ncbi:hypothetical protein HaLaN_02551 [Haematococcus lacustris]|uniref:Uncharacterized protein n=1 Tax=Haematococcus lacustris TaxID=44745 RepID=A0A699YXG8_HAELA|nr:hypothetical protein HaLaN_02551 [Haematococcus lacustris]
MAVQGIGAFTGGGWGTKWQASRQEGVNTQAKAAQLSPVPAAAAAAEPGWLLLLLAVSQPRCGGGLVPASDQVDYLQLFKNERVTYSVEDDWQPHRVNP